MTTRKTAPIRVPEDVKDQATRIAALRGVPTAELIAVAWTQFLESHREQFARDLEVAGEIMRDGTRDDLVEFLTMGIGDEAARAAERANA